MIQIVKDIGVVVDKMKSTQGLPLDGPPYYMYGHIAEVNNRLMRMNTDKNRSDKKYPLIVLRLDTVETLEDNMWKYNLNLAIITFTDKNFNAEQREDSVFVPKLYPLYEKFIECLSLVGKFSWDGDKNIPPHDKINRYYYGVETLDLNVRNIFSDPLDAIEIANLKINQSICN